MGLLEFFLDLLTLSIQINEPDGDLMDWAIETSPNIVSASGTGESNGEKVCAIYGLNYETTYKWFVNTTDGTNWILKNYTMIGNYYDNRAYSDVGTYFYFIWVRDINNNTNQTTPKQFKIIS